MSRSAKPYDVRHPIDPGMAEDLDAMLEELYSKIRSGEGSADDLRAAIDAIHAKFPVAEAEGGTGETVYDKGDLVVGDGSGLARLPVGADDQVLTADSSATNGVRWKVPVGGGGTGRYEPLTDGDLTEPELVFALGDVVMVHMP